MPFLKSAYLSLTLLLGLVIQANAQRLLDQEISVPTGEFNPEQLFERIKAAGVSVGYSQDMLPDKNWINKQEKQSIKWYLDDLKNQTRIQYKLVGEIVVISYTQLVVSNRRATIRGFVRNAETGEAVIGATVHKVNSNKGTVTNRYGYYSLSLTEGPHLIQSSSVGYNAIADTLYIKQKNKIINFKLYPKTTQLTDVIISAVDPAENLTSLIPSRNTINLNTKGQIPYFMGEIDVLQGALLLPGISTLGEDANGLNIRGGTVDQNLIYLDEATVYNPNHLFGLISIFNPETVNNIEIMKGFIPPSYGGRTSSVITVNQKEGNDQNFSVTGGVGLLSARLIAEGPIKKNKSSFIASARQSLLNLTLEDDLTRASFRDLNLKVNLKANRENTFYLSGYFGTDNNKNDFDRENKWGNRNISARWNHLFGPRVFANFSAIISEYRYQVTQPQEAASFIGQSRITDYTLKTDWSYTISPKHEIEFGGSSIFHELEPGNRIPFQEGSSSSNPLFLDTENGLENAVYISHQFKMSQRLSALYGVRLSSLHTFGPGRKYLYSDNFPRSNSTITDTLTYGSGDIIDVFYGLEPRASVVLKLNHHNSLKASYSRTYQYLHLISNTISPSPTDIWKLTDGYIPPTQSDHYSFGYYQNLNDNKWEAYVEFYYKHLDNLVEYKSGANLLFNENLETELLSAEGRSYGAEFFLKKNVGDLTGWISYTLSRSEVKVASNFPEEGINEGNFFPANHDKLHSLSLVGIYEILPRLSGSFSFNLNSGAPFTLPVSKYQFEGITVQHYRDRNQSRLPNYHRLDLSLKLIGRDTRKNGDPRKLNDYWTLTVYNVYGRDNVYSYFFRENGMDNSTEIVPNTIFDSPIPAITYHFKF